MGSSFFVVRPVKFIKICYALFTENKITQASAALSYYLTMTFFPLLIIAYSFMDESYARTEQIVKLGEKILSEDLLIFISDFLLYIDSGDSRLMLPLGLSLLLGYASAGLRCVQSTIGGIQGGSEYKGLSAFLFSFLYCLALLAVSYLAIIVMLSGPALVEGISNAFPASRKLLELIPVSHVLLAGVLFLLLLGFYHVPKRARDKYRVLPGAAAASAAVLILSPLFSFVMRRSVKYSLIYGALASLVLLMLWLYMCCVLIYCGVILNVALHEVKKK